MAICFSEFQALLIVLGIVLMTYLLFVKEAPKKFSGTLVPLGTNAPKILTERRSDAERRVDAERRSDAERQFNAVQSPRSLGVQRVTVEPNPDFPMGRYIGGDFDSGTIGYIKSVSDPSVRLPLYVTKVYGRWYYYTNISGIRTEFDGMPRSMELYDGDTLQLENTSYTVKLYRTSLF